MVPFRKRNRRFFLRHGSQMLGAGLAAIPLSHQTNMIAPQRRDVPDNPLILFDNFHSGNRRSYSLEAKFNSANKAGFDGFEMVSVDPSSDQWKQVLDLMPGTNFKVWGLHWTSKVCIDRFADEMDKDMDKMFKITEACATNSIEYISLSLSGTDELAGPTIHESGSAKAEERHWDRAYKIIRAFDRACKKAGIRGALYPHTHWICDTPQSQQKILDGAEAETIGPAFCSHHWYANQSSAELDQVLTMPMMKRLNYVVLTNGRFSGNRFPAVPFDEGEIDMAWLLAKMIEFGYEGPISSQGWGIGGDPYLVSKSFVDGIRALKYRFKNEPDLWPLK